MSTAQRKAYASLRMVRIRRTQDRIALIALHQAQEAERMLEDRQARIRTAQHAVQPHIGSASAQDISSRLSLSGQLERASLPLQLGRDQAQQKTHDAMDERRITHQALRLAEMRAEVSQRDAVAEAERRSAQNLIPQKRGR
jgi:hypothetical protein